MTLVDEAEHLTTLAGQADAAGDAGSAEAALREVFERLIAARHAVAHGVVEPHWWEYVPELERQAVRDAAELAAGATAPLQTESDQVLAAYGRGDATMDRGALGALLRNFREYGSALGRAQDAVLRGWSEHLWPADKHPELELHALVPESAVAARALSDVTKEIADAIDESRILSAEALGRLFDRCEAAKTNAASLREIAVPAAVVTFFKQIAHNEIVPLRDIAAEVFAWLDEHDATGLFVVSRADR